MKAEEFIKEHTMDCSNQIINGKYGTIIPHFNPWLTPDQARKAVEMAKEEVIENTCEWLKEYLLNHKYIGIMDLCDEYIKAMRKEE